MRIDLETRHSRDDHDAFVSDSDLIGYFQPSEIVHDPLLTVGRKRQLLAFWGSDIHAVRGAPALRSYAYGPAVSIDDIQAALVELDTMVDAPAMAHAAMAGARA